MADNIWLRKIMNYRIAISSLAILCACIFFTDKKNHVAVSVLLGVGALVSTGVFVGSFLHHMSEHSVAQKMFHVFTLFLVPTIIIVTVIALDEGDFWSVVADVYFTADELGRFGKGKGRALDISILMVAGITAGCYLCEDEVRWGVTMFCVWAVIGMGVAAAVLGA